MIRLYVRARLSLAVAARELADLSRGVVGDLATPMPRGERIRKARRARLMSLTLVDRAVLVELSEGASWEDVAAALSLDVEEAVRRYEPVWTQWKRGEYDDEDDFGDFGIGLRGDLDPEGTADALDQWYRRHAEPWESSDPDVRPVRQSLVNGQGPAGDRQGVEDQP